MSQKYVVGSRDWASPQGILLCTALRTGETLRADEIVIEVADGRPSSILVNATPLRAIKSSTASLLHEVATLDAGELLRCRWRPIRHVPASSTEAVGSLRG